MVIQKVINNNVISAYDVNQQEIVIMGKGIGFKAHTGELIDGKYVIICTLPLKKTCRPSGRHILFLLFGSKSFW